MEVIIAARHMDVTPALREHAEAGANKLTRYYDLIKEIEVVVTLDTAHHQNHVTVEMIVRADHKDVFVAHDAEGDAYRGIDACVAKLERALTEHKKRFRNRKHP